MVYAIKCSREVAKHAGARRRAGFTFTRTPTFFGSVPEGVESDPHLEVGEVDKLPEGTKLADGPTPAAEPKPKRRKAKR